MGPALVSPTCDMKSPPVHSPTPEPIPPVIGIYQPYPHTYGGVQAMAIKLAQGLPERGYRPLIVSPEPGSFTARLANLNLPFIISDPGPRWHVYGRGAKSWSYL